MAKYSVEISYNLDKVYKISQIELIVGYMKIIKENKEISEKDDILNKLGSKYNTEMNSHDFDVKVENMLTQGTILKRNTNFELNKVNIINFIKDIPENYYIRFINKKVGSNIQCIYTTNGTANLTNLNDLDNEILKLVKQ